MIISKRKPFSEILESIEGLKKVFIVGCTLCATTCKTGGEKEVKEITEALQEEGKTVTGWNVPDPACSLLAIKRLYRSQKKEIDESDVILSLACGGGTQAIAEIIPGKRVCPGNDTLFQGEITESTLKKVKFEQKCSLCGECVLASTGSICPVTRCPKSLVNGPCGGVKNGKCEISSDLDCAWMLIYEQLKSDGRLDEMKKVRRAKDHSKNKSPQNFIV